MQIKIGGKTVESYSHHAVKQRREVVSINASTAVPTNVLAGGQLEFRLEDQVDRLSHVDLRVNWASTATPPVVAFPQAWIESVQIYSDNGSTLLYQSNASLENYVIDGLTQSFTENINSAGVRGTNTTYASGTLTLPTNTFGYFYIPLATQFWRATHIRPYSIQGNLIIRVKFATAALNIVSGTITTPSVDLRAVHFRESPEQKQWIISRAMNPKAIWYHAPQRHIEQITINGINPVKVRLSGLKGDAICLMVMLRAVADLSIPASQFTFQLLETYEILNAEDQSIVGYNPVRRDEAQLIYGRMFDNTFFPTVGAILHSFSQTPKHDLIRGTIGGFERFSGFHSIRITPTGLPNGAYELFVIAMCAEAMHIVGGRVRTTRS